MVVEEPTERIDANNIFDEITTSDKRERYCGHCCFDNLGNEEDSWHGSETDEEYEAAIDSPSKSNTISPAVTWNSTTTNASVQSPVSISEVGLMVSSPSELRFHKTSNDSSQQRAQNSAQPLAQANKGKIISTESQSQDTPPPPPPKPSHLSLPIRKLPEQQIDRKSSSFNAENPDLETYLVSLRSQGEGQLEKYIDKVLKAASRNANDTNPLHVATRIRDTTLSRELVKMIVDKSDLINMADMDLNSPLHSAVEVNRLVLVRYLLSHGADVSHTNAKGQTALHLAVEKHHTSMVSTLLRQANKTLLDVRDNTGQTALHLACVGGYTDVVSVLLENGASTDLTDRAWRTPEMVSNMDEAEEISALFELARDVRATNLGASSSIATAATGVQAPILDRPPPDHVYSPSNVHCVCEVCKLLDISSKMEEAALNERIECACFDCLENLAAATISDFDLVTKALEQCGCAACSRSKDTIFCLCETAEEMFGEPIPFSVDPFDDAEFAAFESEYEARLQMKVNKPPCCTDCDPKRVRECVVALSEGDFRKVSYRMDPDGALLTAMKRFESLDKIETIVLFLLENGANIGTKGLHNRTLLHLAAKYGNVALTRILLDRGADYDAETIATFSNDDGWTPLSYAIYGNHDLIAYLLLKQGARVDDLSRYRSSRTILHDLIDPKWRNLFMLKILLRYRPNLEVLDYNSATPLHYAITCSDVETASILLKAGSYIEAPGKDGYKPLALAIQSRNLEMVRLLLDSEVNIHCRCGPCPNALHYAAQSGGWAVLEEVLAISTLDDINASDAEGRTVMHVFAQGNHWRDEIPGMLDKLSESGASLDAEDIHGSTPLHYAVMAGNLMMVSDLVDIGANEYARNRAGKTPLDLAKAKRNKEMVNILGGELKRRWFRKQ